MPNATSRRRRLFHMDRLRAISAESKAMLPRILLQQVRRDVRQFISFSIGPSTSRHRISKGKRSLPVRAISGAPKAPLLPVATSICSDPGAKLLSGNSDTGETRIAAHGLWRPIGAHRSEAQWQESGSALKLASHGRPQATLLVLLLLHEGKGG